MASSPAEGEGGNKRLWLPVLFLVLGLLLTAAAVYQTSRMLEQERQAALEGEATRIRGEFILRLYRHLDVLRLYKAEYAVHADFSRPAFALMTETLNLRERVPGIEAIGHTGVAGLNPSESYVFHDLNGSPLLQKEALQGLPLDPIQLDALHRARDTGEFAATAPLDLGSSAHAKVNMVYLPLYDGVTVPETVEARREQFAGAVFIVLRPATIMQSMLLGHLLPSSRARLVFEGYQHTTPWLYAPTVVYESYRDEAPTHPPQAQVVEKRIPVSFAGTSWSLELNLTDAARPGSERWLFWAVLALGALLSILSALAVMGLQRAREQSLHKAGMDRDRRREAEAALHLRERAIDAAANAIVIASATERGYPVVYVNPAFERMTGYTADEIKGRSLRIMHGTDTGQEGVAALQTLLREKREGDCILRNYRRNGELYWTQVFIAPVRDDSGHVTHFVAAKYDITQKRIDQQKLEFQAWHDALTQLPNRHALRAELTRVTKESGKNAPFWVAFMDLDNFKLINDAVGHTLGDQALREIASRLQKALPAGDMVARRGGDEFVFILADRSPPFGALATIERMMASVSRPLLLGEHRFFPTCSLGVAIHPQDGEDPETLIRHADMAMYHAKALGRNNYQFFSKVLQEQALERVNLEEDLRKALAEEEFELHFQPQICLQDDRLCGVETLVRWRHPEHGLVPPMRFIPLAEETGLIVPLGDWILKRACEYAAQWQEAGYCNLRVAVNLSARQFNEDHLPELINRILAETGLPAERLELEITETMLVDNVESANRILHRLKGLGVTLSLDDFGTGYSSLAQLKRFPLDIIKIDRSFVSDINDEHSSEAITRTIIELAHNLGMLAVAEGVETLEQKAFLRGHGCDVIQGYLISRPLPAPAFEQWMRENTISHTL